MKRKFSAEQIVAILKQAELWIPVARLIRQAGICEQTYSEFGGLKLDQARGWIEDLYVC